MLVESHIHLTHAYFDGEVKYINGKEKYLDEKLPCICSEENDERIVKFTREELIQEYKKQEIGFCIEPAIDLESNFKVIQLAKEYPGYIYATVGIHPTRTYQTKWSDKAKLEELVKDKNVVAVGELGLDYHYDRWKQHRFAQKRWFKWQLELAKKNKLPLVLHLRKADKDAIKILRKYARGHYGGVCHCFSSDVETAKILTEELGFYLGIGPKLLQGYNTSLQQVVREIPLEYLVLETDGPFIKPDKPDTVSGNQWKKARSTSLLIKDIAAKIAQIKGIELAEVERETTNNAVDLFRVSDPLRLKEAQKEEKLIMPTRVNEQLEDRFLKEAMGAFDSVTRNGFGERIPSMLIITYREAVEVDEFTSKYKPAKRWKYTAGKLEAIETEDCMFDDSSYGMYYKIVKANFDYDIEEGIAHFNIVFGPLFGRGFVFDIVAEENESSEENDIVYKVVNRRMKWMS